MPKSSLVHSKFESQGAQRMMNIVLYVRGLTCWVWGYRESRWKISSKYFLRENISCTSKIDLPYYFDYYAIVCTCCCVGGTQRTLNKSVEHYPQCQKFMGNRNTFRRKITTIVEGDFQKKKKVYIQLINVEKIIKTLSANAFLFTIFSQILSNPFSTTVQS